MEQIWPFQPNYSIKLVDCGGKAKTTPANDASLH